MYREKSDAKGRSHGKSREASHVSGSTPRLVLVLGLRPWIDDALRRGVDGNFLPNSPLLGLAVV